MIPRCGSPVGLGANRVLTGVGVDGDEGLSRFHPRDCSQGLNQDALSFEEGALGRADVVVSNGADERDLARPEETCGGDSDVPSGAARDT